MHIIIKIKITFAVLVVATLLAIYATIYYSDIEDTLLPSEQSAIPWRVYSSTDVVFGGTSSIDIRDSTYNLNFDFNLHKGPEFPYAMVGLTFEDNPHPEKLVDWSHYSSINFRMKCRPANVLNFTLYTHDDQVTVFSPHMSTYRPSVAFIRCGEDWQTIHINLHQLTTAEWWLRKYNVNLADSSYSLDKVRGFVWTNSAQSPMDVASGIAIQALYLERENWLLVYMTLTLGLLLWGGFFYWCIPHLRLKPNSQTLHEAAPLNYQPLSTEPRHERDKDAVINYLASKYPNPDLSVDLAVADLGINRTKINDILRDETGLTFSTYLNKLRLTEAARLLSDKQMGVAEAAFAVGYNSLSYFNRVFKKEFGCTPSSYKAPVDIKPAPGATDSDPAP